MDKTLTQRELAELATLDPKNTIRRFLILMIPRIFDDFKALERLDEAGPHLQALIDIAWDASVQAVDVPMEEKVPANRQSSAG